MTRHVVRFRRPAFESNLLSARCSCRWGSDGVREFVVSAAEKHAHDNSGRIELAGAA